MLGPCWHYFSFLGAFFRSQVLLGRFLAGLGRFGGVLEPPGLDFGGFRVGPERVLEARNTYFSKFFRACELAVLKRFDKRFVWEKPIRNTCRPVCVPCKKRSKIDPGAFRTEVPAKNVILQLDKVL